MQTNAVPDDLDAALAAAGLQEIFREGGPRSEADLVRPSSAESAWCSTGRSRRMVPDAVPAWQRSAWGLAAEMLKHPPAHQCGRSQAVLVCLLPKLGLAVWIKPDS